MSKPFVVGQTVRVDVRFRNPASRALEDPSGAVTVHFKDPADNVTDVPATREATGKFFARINPDSAGLWRYRADSALPDVGVDEGEFLVEASSVLP